MKNTIYSKSMFVFITALLLGGVSNFMPQEAYALETLDISSTNGGAYGFTFTPLGDKMFVSAANWDRLYEYDCSENFIIKSCVDNGNWLSVKDLTDCPAGIYFSNIGDKFFLVDCVSAVDVEKHVFQFDCSVNFSIKSCVYNDKSLLVFVFPNYDPVEGYFVDGLAFSSSGDKMFVSISLYDDIHEYDCSENFIIKSCVYKDKLHVDNYPQNIFGIAFSLDGKTLLLSYRYSVEQYDCSDSFTLATCEVRSGLSFPNPLSCG